MGFHCMEFALVHFLEIFLNENERHGQMTHLQVHLEFTDQKLQVKFSLF